MQPQINNVPWQELFTRMSQCGYRFVNRIKQDLENLRQEMPKEITAHVAQLPGSPPVFLVKGPLFDTSALQQSGSLQVEYVITLTQQFPNSYPILTVEAPPQGWGFRQHPNVDRQGCCHLPSIARWNPQSSTIVACAKELQRVLWANPPFQLLGGAMVPPPQQRQQQQQQPPAPTVVSAPAPAPQQQQPPPPMPQQTLNMGAMIFGATNLANGRTDAEAARQRQEDLEWRQRHEQQLRQSAPPPSSGAIDGSLQLGHLMTGNISKPSTVFNCPIGLGVGKVSTGLSHQQPLLVVDGIPMPLPPCQEPTPDVQYQQAEAMKANERIQKEQHAQNKSSSWGSLGRALNIGATAISNMASQAASSVEQSVRDSHAQRERQEFQFLFPTFAQREQLAVQYPASALTGLACGVTGLMFITNVGVHFTTRRTDSAPVPITVNHSVAWSSVASIVKGAALGYEWLHLVMDNGMLYSFYNITTTTTGMVGEQMSSLKGTPYSRCYIWMDHRWRAVRTVNNNNGNYNQFQAPPPQVQGPQNVVQAIPAGAPPKVAEADLCVVCQERQKNQFFQPCGHVCCCAACAATLTTCPMCRATIQNKFQAFL